MKQSLTQLNTLGVKSQCDELLVISELNALVDAVGRCQHNKRPMTLIGGGSNIVLRSLLEGTVINVGLKGIEFDEESGQVTVGAGENWHNLVSTTIRQGWTGLENLSLIPGSVGAAPIQNIGAYGVELADRFVSLEAINIETGERQTLDREACQFGYRASVLKETRNYVVLSVCLQLSRDAELNISYPELKNHLEQTVSGRPTAQDIAQSVITVRKNKLPDVHEIGNAGSFFKNPMVTLTERDKIQDKISLDAYSTAGGRYKISAARLIDECGWKGKSRYGVGVWHKQPLVLINENTDKGEDFLSMAHDISTSVEDKFGVTLEIEPVILGS